MKLGSLASARPQYYDRAPATKSQLYSATLAPHADTQRWSYTVPAGYKAYVETAYALSLQQTAPTVAAGGYAGVFTNTDDALASIVSYAYLVAATAATQSAMGVSGVALLNPGNNIFGQSSDGSTGGTRYIVISAKYSTFLA